MDGFSTEAAHILLDTLAGHEKGPKDHHGCEVCQRPGTPALPRYQCLDCGWYKVMCKGCLFKAHVKIPFHQVQEWDVRSGFWSNRLLTGLGLELHFGHRNGKYSYSIRDPRPMHIVSMHGIHKVGVHFCFCPDRDTAKLPPEAEQAAQLVAEGYWPSTWKQPCTAFSIRLMKQFDLLACQSQVSAYDFSTQLVRMTDNVTPQDVDVCLFDLTRYTFWLMYCTLTSLATRSSSLPPGYSTTSQR